MEDSKMNFFNYDPDKVRNNTKIFENGESARYGTYIHQSFSKSHTKIQNIGENQGNKDNNYQESIQKI